MNLVIVESPAKAKTIEKYLGKGYKVKASKGHVVDLPKSGLGVDTEKDFEPTYVVTKNEVVKDLKKDLKLADSLILAVDPDREGEAIGWHLARELGVIDSAGRHKKGKVDLKRIVFTEITENAVQEAIKAPRSIDMDLVNAQQARRVLDRLVGYKLSPLLWKKIRFGLSAGRVQSVAVKLIVDREQERNDFKPEEYWSIHGEFDPKKGELKLFYKLKKTDEDSEDGEEAYEPEADSEAPGFNLISIKGKKVEITKQSEVEKLFGEFGKLNWSVKDIEKQMQSKNPPTPFTTSTLQITTSMKLGFTAKKTMTIAQKLYEHGHITYMRTDSTNLSAQAIDGIRKHVTKTFGEKYLPKSAVTYKTKSKVAQEAHEAIRATHFDKKASDLKLEGDEARLYDLILGRTLACQMVPAQLERSTLKVTDKDGNYIWQAAARKVVFPGYMKAYPEKISEGEIPDLKKDQTVYLTTANGVQHFTEPPARYSEPTLIKELDLGIEAGI